MKRMRSFLQRLVNTVREFLHRRQIQETVEAADIEGMTNDAIADLTSALSVFRPLDSLANLGALQLMPENADHYYRLEALAHIVAAIPPDISSANISRDELAFICESEGLAQLTHLEDPFENPFTEAFTYIGGSYIVFPGSNEEVTYALRQLSAALHLHPEPFPHPTFRREVHELLSAVLTLSDEIARRAYIDRGAEPIPGLWDPIRIPDAEKLTLLKGAVSFTREDLEALLQRQAVPLSALDPLIIPQGSCSLGTYTVETGDLISRPIVTHEDEFVVALPGMLLAAARDAIVAAAIDRGVAANLADRFHEAVSQTVLRSLRLLDYTALPIRLPDNVGIRFASEFFFSQDVDKVLYVLLITDRISDSDPNDLDEGIMSRLDIIERHIYQSLPNANDSLFLILRQGVINWQVLTLGGQDEMSRLTLDLSAADLETFAWIETGDKLALYKYAWASKDIRRQTAILALGGVLSDFQLYRSRHYSYYLSDEERPTHITVSLGGAGDLRREVLRNRDFHAVQSYNPGTFVEVTTLHDTRAVPLYTPTNAIASGRTLRAAVLTEGMAIPIWVVGPRYETDEHRAQHSHYAQIANAIGYWFWQFMPRLNPLVETLTPSYEKIVVNLNIIPSDAWQTIAGMEAAAGTGLDPIQTEVDLASGNLTVTLHPNFPALLRGINNNGERTLLRTILEAFRELLPPEQRTGLATEEISSILDEYAPLGLKKMILLLAEASAPELDPTGLPHYRKVQPADENRILDQLGENLLSFAQVTIGPVPAAQRTDLLNASVSYCYQELQRLVRTLSPELLVNRLVAQQEALTQHLAFRRLTIPTRLACFGTEPELVEQLTEEVPQLSEAATASRFIIEYVTACPPTGIRPLSLSVYDRLQALASQIIKFGIESDLIHYNLADLNVEMLRSRRIGVDRDQYEKARQAFLPTFSLAEIARATRAFGGFWSQPGTHTQAPARAAQVDAAAQVEFGHTLMDLVSFMAETIVLARSLDPSCASLPIDELTQRMSYQLGWSAQKTSSVLTLLALSPRPDFLRPSAPFVPQDVLPWRYNRALSYLRRPFLIVQNMDGIRVLWGPRHVNGAWRYLVDLCLSGRLRAATTQMKVVLGEINEERGEQFNDEVADLFESVPQVVVRRKVKHISTTHYPENNLGDIDVLVADPRTKQLRVIETKTLSVGRVPHELANELATIFVGQRGKRSFVEKHQRRVQWVQDNVEQVLAWLGISSAAEWTAESLMVFEYELMSPHIQTSPIPITSIEELRRNLS